MSPSYISFEDAMCGCMEVDGVYGDTPKRLRFHRGRNVIDLDPFFDDRFSARDHFMFTKVPVGYRRHAYREKYKEDGVTDVRSVTEYRFAMEEFLEAFMGRYRPEKLAGFMRLLLVHDDDHSESFIKRIERFYEDYRVILMNVSGHHHDYIELCAINFPDDDLERMVHEGFKGEMAGCLHPSYSGIHRIRKAAEVFSGYAHLNGLPDHVGEVMMFVRPIKYGARPIGKLRELMRKESMGSEPPLILVPNIITGPDLDFGSIIDYYHLPTDNIERVIRVDGP